MLNLEKFKKTEKGNALFLILIAVALFAALSYAITQSGRGGGGIDKEQALISASQITQYAAGLRTTVTRMSITGTTLLDFDFTTPAPGGATASDQVFHSSGGGAIEQDPPVGASAYKYLVPATATTGYFINGIGGDTSPDIFVVTEPTDSLGENVCEEINRGLGFDPVTPPSEATAFDDTATAATWDGSAAAAHAINSTDGEAFSCINNGGGGLYMYFHALVEN